MPHKHVRQRDADNDASRHNLPPTQKANPLPVGKHGQSVFTANDNAEKSKKRKRKAQSQDDTPKAFARLMKLHQHHESGAKGKAFNGLDDGRRQPKSKKRKVEDQQQQQPEPVTKSSAPTTTDMPKILPGEKFSDFAARVDRALPVLGLARKRNANQSSDQDIAVLKERRTRTEKKLHKLYDSWRKDEAARIAKLEEAREKEEELADEAAAEDGEEHLYAETRQKGLDAEADANLSGKKLSKRKRRLMIGETKDKDDHPWLELKKMRDEKKRKVYETNAAPPEFKAVPKEKFKTRDAKKGYGIVNVPNAAGSLKRREELGEERKAIIERYRAMMSASKS